MPEQPEKRLLARTSSFLHDLLPWESLRPGKETTAGGHFFSSENRITWNLGFRPRLDPLVHPVFCPCCNCGWWRTLGTASRPESLRGSCPSSQQPAAPPAAPYHQHPLRPSPHTPAPRHKQQGAAPCVAPAAWHTQSRAGASARGSQQLAGHLSAWRLPCCASGRRGGPGGALDGESLQQDICSPGHEI